jgi:hypothetical protein
MRLEPGEGVPDLLARLPRDVEQPTLAPGERPEDRLAQVSVSHERSHARADVRNSLKYWRPRQDSNLGRTD